jgi:hypothetical protein
MRETPLNEDIGILFIYNRLLKIIQFQFERNYYYYFMEYFVSTDQRAYHDWQIELMIESFKAQGLENKLIITAAETNEQRYNKLHNTLGHAKYFQHSNIGMQRGFSKLNELYSLAWCINNGKINYPICIMQPHVVLFNKNYEINFPEGQASLNVAIDPFFTFQLANQKAGDFWQKQINTMNYYKDNWLPIGSLIFINNIPIEFINRTIAVAEYLIVEQIINKIPVWEDTVKLAWVINTIDFIGRININASYIYASSMNNGNITPFIDYNHGLSPHFNKSMFLYAPPVCMSFGDPIETLLNCHSSPNADYMSELSNKIISSRNKYEPELVKSEPESESIKSEPIEL